MKPFYPYQIYFAAASDNRSSSNDEAKENDPHYHRVGPNDSILSIAKSAGFFWKTIWNHGNNSELKTKRKEPEILQPGDWVYVPDLDPKKVSKPNESKHKFKLKGEQAKFQIQLKELGEPRADEDYTLIIDGVITTGKTDGDGWVRCDIPNDASGGELILLGGKERIPIHIGQLDPIDSARGVRQRLTNLGYEASGGDLDEMPKEAITLFQTKNQLTPADGEYTADTKAKLLELHST